MTALPDMQPAASHFVNGAALEDRAGDAISVVYPATGEVIATVHAATPAVIEAAVAGAARAQADWAGWTGTARRGCCGVPPPSCASAITRCR
jgi:betaine-aldehyde dehydrogenase